MTTDPLIGRQLGNYRIERAIGRGGMAQVYYGRDVKLDRPVAIKVIDARFRGKPAYAERFVREAKAAAAWRHEHIVQIYYADDEDELYYFAMEYVDGQDLGQLIAAHRAKGARMPHDEVLRIGHAFAEALDFIHAQGVIHRDVKPSNVMVARDGRVVLTDFGLALDVGEGSLGEVFGTSHYIAPEQARRSADAVPQSDLYSLGVILYEALTGILPFDDPSPTAVAVQHITLMPPRPREVNPQLNQATEDVLLKALSKSPDERYQSGGELMDALAKALAGQSAAAGSLPAAAGPPAVARRPGRSGADDLIGQQVDEYRLEALLGQGGMARVYRGLDVRLNRWAAIKVIDTPFRTDADYVMRFEREARAIAQLEHPHIVRLYRYGEAGGLLYMAMQYVEGRNLHAVLASYRKKGVRIPAEEIGRIIREVCLALDYAHGKGVIHRDVKPSNIMLDEQGNAVLTDFGLALLTEVGTRGEILGSPHHLAPEQAISSANVVPQTDLYAVGVILYEMVTGELPFDAKDPLDVVMKHISEPPPSPRALRPEVSPALEGVLLKALAKSPDERYPSGATLADALDQALFGTPVAEPAAAAEPPPPQAQPVAGLPPIPAAVAPAPAEPRPEPLSITSAISGKAATGTEPTAPSRFRTPALVRRASPPQIVAGAVVSLAVVLGIAFLLLRGCGGGEPARSEDVAAPGAATSQLAAHVDTGAGTPARPAATSAEPAAETATSTPLPAPTPTAGATPALTPPAATPTAGATPTLTPPVVLAISATSTPAPTPTPLPYRLAFTRWDGGKHTIWLADLDGKNQVRVRDFAASPAWSPDGEQIAFVGEQGINSQVGFGSGGVWKMSAAGWNPQQLKQDGTAHSVAWMPGGKSIAHDSDRAGYGVYFVSPYGDEQPGTVPGEYPAWSPDGSRLAVRACRPDCGVWIANRDNSAPRQLTWGSTDGLPAWSPDGGRIAFNRGSQDADIFVMPADGSAEPAQLTDARGHDMGAAWTPDGRHLVFRTARSGRWQIWIMNADGSDQRLIIEDARVGNEWGLDRMSIVE
jgi:serine/threonine protein kinase